MYTKTQNILVKCLLSPQKIYIPIYLVNIGNTFLSTLRALFPMPASGAICFCRTDVFFPPQSINNHVLKGRSCEIFEHSESTFPHAGKRGNLFLSYKCFFSFSHINLLPGFKVTDLRDFSKLARF